MKEKRDMHFNFGTDNKEYEYNESKTYFVNYDDWDSEIIPINYRYENLGSVILLTKGFTEEFKDNKLIELQQEMKKVLNDYISKEMVKTMKEYKEKLNCLKGA